RVYVDGLARVDAASVRALFDALDGGPAAVAPVAVGRSGLPGALGRIADRWWTRWQRAGEGVARSPVVGVSAAGRATFGRWPPVVRPGTCLDHLVEPAHKARVADAVQSWQGSPWIP